MYFDNSNKYNPPLNLAKIRLQTGLISVAVNKPLASLEDGNLGIDQLSFDQLSVNKPLASLEDGNTCKSYVSFFIFLELINHLPR